MLRFMVETVWLRVTGPLRALIIDSVREGMLEFALDDPRAGGPCSCAKCDADTVYGVCPQCQPLAYSRLL